MVSMEEDKYALVEKLIKDVETTMLKNIDLNTFEIVPVDENFQNKSPVLHVENCLGLEAWCVKHVYMYCYTEIMGINTLKAKRKVMKLTSENYQRFTRLLNVILLLHPELHIMWNKRREIYDRDWLDTHGELVFTRLVLSRKGKCNDAMAYRRWLLDRTLDVETQDMGDIENVVEEEYCVCETTAEKSKNNYHSWNHRMWLTSMLVNKQIYDPGYLYIREFTFSEQWSSKHVSDFSCFYYRQYCMKNVMTVTPEVWRMYSLTMHNKFRKNFVRVIVENLPLDYPIRREENLVTSTDEKLLNILMPDIEKDCKCVLNHSFICRKLDILFYELVANKELVKFYNHHETLWYHRRYVVNEILTLMYDYFGLVKNHGTLVPRNCKVCKPDVIKEPSQSRGGTYSINDVLQCQLFKILVGNEKRYIEDRQVSMDNFSMKYEKYLRYIEGFHNVLHIVRSEEHLFDHEM